MLLSLNNISTEFKKKGNISIEMNNFIKQDAGL